MTFVFDSFETMIKLFDSLFMQNHRENPFRNVVRPPSLHTQFNGIRRNHNISSLLGELKSHYKPLNTLT